MVSKAEKVRAICEKRNIYKSNSETFFKFLPNEIIDGIMVKAVNKEIVNYKFIDSKSEDRHYGSFSFSEECGDVKNTFRFISETQNQTKPMAEQTFSTGAWCGGIFYNYGMDMNIPEHREYLRKILEETTNTDYPLYDNGIEIHSSDLLDVWSVEGIPEYFSIYEDHNMDRGLYQEGRFRHLNRFTDFEFNYQENKGFYYRKIEHSFASAKIGTLYEKRRRAKKKFNKFLAGLTRQRVFKYLPNRVPFPRMFKKYILCHRRDGVFKEVIDNRLWSYDCDMKQVYYTLVNGEWRDEREPDATQWGKGGRMWARAGDPARYIIQKRYIKKWEDCLDKYEKIFWEVQLGRTDIRMFQNQVYECNTRIYSIMRNIKGFRDPHDSAWKSDYRELIEDSPDWVL